MSRRARRIGAVGAAALLVATSAHAQGRTPSGGAPWVPTLSLDPSSMPAIEGTVVPAQGEVQVGLALEWIHAPVQASAAGRVQTLVDGRFVSTLGAQVGFGGGLSFGLQLPVVGYQSAAASSVTTAGATPIGLGDARALLRWAVRSAGSALGPIIPATNLSCQGVCSRDWSTGFALDLAVTAPTAGAELAGYGATTARLGATFEARSFRYGLVASVAYLARVDGAWPTQDAPCGSPGGACLVDTALRDRVQLSIGLRHPIGALLGTLGALCPILADLGTLLTFVTENTLGAPYLSFVASLDGRAPFTGPSAMELGFGSQRRLGSFTITAGGAHGFGELTQGTWRVLLGLMWQPPNDEDGDGVGDDSDQCIGVPGTAAMHGCIDERGDVDHDGVVFPADQCPTLAEDLNGVDDQDGCPDADRDGDGVPDARDECPGEASGERPDRVLRGCPRRGAQKHGKEI